MFQSITEHAYFVIFLTVVFFNETTYFYETLVKIMKSITVQELKSMIDNNVEHVLIDVREQGEYALANINGILIPTSEFANRYSEVPKEGKVIVQCRSGQRSANVIAWLEQNHGYENLYNLQGGIIAWAHEIDPDLTVG